MHPTKSSFMIGSLVVVSLFAPSLSQARETFQPPRPPMVVEPVRLPPNVERQVVQLRLVIDQSGHARKIAVLAPCDQLIEIRLLAHVAKWQFTPATENGQPVEAEVILPVHLFESDSVKTRL